MSRPDYIDFAVTKVINGSRLSGTHTHPPSDIRQSVTAAENIKAYEPVLANGRCASSSQVSTIGTLLGLSLTAINTGFSGSVALMGEVQNPGWAWTAGDPIYLNGTQLSKTPPATGYLQGVGVAKNSTTIVLERSTPILL